MTNMRKYSIIYVCSWCTDVRRVANRQPFVLFSRVVRFNAVLSKETMDGESSEVLEMWEGIEG